ncbi:type II toxin-antitoxin system [compost metagenome]
MERLVVMKRGEPVAVILNVEAYEELLDQLEDLRVEVSAGERVLSLNKGQLISNEEMRVRFAKAP